MLKIRYCFDRVPGMGLALLVVGVSLPLAAQVATPLSCNVLSVPTQSRAEGLTELIGDIILSCTGGLPTPVNQPIPQGNIAVFLNTSVTSRILGSNGASEALLLIDEPRSPSDTLSPSSPQRLCPGITGCVVPGNGGAGEVFNGSDASHPNIFQGVVSANSVTFQGVPIEAPAGGGVRTYRITNVRINASGLSSSTSLIAQAIANVSVSGSTALPLNSPQRIVSNILGGLSFAAGAVVASKCSALSNTTQLASLLYTEGHATAFRTRTTAGADPTGAAAQRSPGFDYNTESGFIFPDLPGAGLADFGTRFKAVLQNIPPGVNVWVSATNVGASSASLAQLTASESGAYFPLSSTTTLQGIGAVQIPVVNGTAKAVWEVTAASPVVIETFFFAVFFDSTTTPDISAQSVTVKGSFAPTQSVFPPGDGTQAQPSSFPIPRFVDTSTASPILSVIPCQTLLLFPFVENQNGFDTGLAIANTSTDPIGTQPGEGTCTLSAYGANAAAPVVTATVAPGTDYTVLTSSIFPNFSGYVFAMCNFQYAHGFAFVSDAGARNLAMGYLALVVGSGVTRPGAVRGESTAH